MSTPLARPAFVRRCCNGLLALCLLSDPAIGAPPAGQPAPVGIDDITLKLKSGQPLVFATFGDSITYPCYHNDWRQNYVTFTVDALRKAYPKASVRIVHAGNMGTARRGLDATRFDRYVLSHKPDVVFIMFGMNEGGGLDPFDRDLTKLIDKTRQSGALPIVLTQNEIIYDSVDGRGRRGLPLYLARAVQVAKREKAPVVDCFAAWKPLAADQRQLAARLNDWIHPNLAGHRLFAKTICQTLWPEAAEFISADVATPNRPGTDPPVACLLPGPRGKQVLRAEGGTWLALWGRRRGGEISDLVFSHATKERPTWSDFTHLTLIGRKPQAVFDHQDRRITAGMLLEREGRVYVVFSWNVGVFMVSIDLNKADWAQRAADMAAWLELTDGPFPRPSIVTYYHPGDGAVLYDGFVQPNGWPAVFCTGFLMAPGAGWEVVKGQEGIWLVTRELKARDPVRQFMFPGHSCIRSVQTTDGKVHYFAQEGPGKPLHAGTVGAPASTATLPAASEMFLPYTARRPTAVIQVQPASAADDGQWLLLHWGSPSEPASHALRKPTETEIGGMIPLPWSSPRGDGITWQKVPRPTAGQPSFAHQSNLSGGQDTMGLLIDDRGQMEFLVRPLSGVNRTIIRTKQ